MFLPKKCLSDRLNRGIAFFCARKRGGGGGRWSSWFPGFFLFSWSGDRWLWMYRFSLLILVCVGVYLGRKSPAGMADCVRSSSSVFGEGIMRDKRPTFRERETPFANSRWVLLFVLRRHPKCLTVPAPWSIGGSSGELSRANALVPGTNVWRTTHTHTHTRLFRLVSYSAAASVKLLECRLAICGEQLPWPQLTPAFLQSSNFYLLLHPQEV